MINYNKPIPSINTMVKKPTTYFAKTSTITYNHKNPTIL